MMAPSACAAASTGAADGPAWTRLVVSTVGTVTIAYKKELRVISSVRTGGRPFADFHTMYPSVALAKLEALRAREYARLDDHSRVHLDYTGTGLHATSQVREHVSTLESCVLGNPHPINPTSNAASCVRDVSNV